LSFIAGVEGSLLHSVAARLAAILPASWRRDSHGSAASDKGSLRQQDGHLDVIADGSRQARVGGQQRHGLVGHRLG
jgi:hypothetical protein